MNFIYRLAIAAISLLVFCVTHPSIGNAQAQDRPMPAKRFVDDVQLLSKHTDAVVLRRDRAAIVVVPEYQGRVMTATARGEEGLSSGWINDALVKQGVVSDEQAKGSLDEHMYAFGGEERFWMGPEGG
ncbi:MAG: DUF6786 family protein, partial [Planctomycetota bacterium]